MPNSVQSVLLRIATFIAIGASMWYRMVKTYSMLAISQYGQMLSMFDNQGAVMAIAGIIYAVILYVLYGVYAKMCYISFSKYLYFYDKTTDIFSFRKVLDIAFIAICSIKALLSLIYYYNALYESVVKAIVHPLLAVAVLAMAVAVLIKKYGKECKAGIISSLAFLLCIPVIFV